MPLLYRNLNATCAEAVPEPALNHLGRFSMKRDDRFAPEQGTGQILICLQPTTLSRPHTKDRRWRHRSTATSFLEQSEIWMLGS